MLILSSLTSYKSSKSLIITKLQNNRNEGIAVDFVIWLGSEAIGLTSWFHWCGDGCSVWSKVNPVGREEGRVLSKIKVLDSAFTYFYFLPLILRAVWVRTFHCLPPTQKPSWKPLGPLQCLPAGICPSPTSPPTGWASNVGQERGVLGSTYKSRSSDKWAWSQRMEKIEEEESEGFSGRSNIICKDLRDSELNMREGKCWMSGKNNF